MARSNEQTNTFPEWIHRFIWSTMVRVISDHWSWSAPTQRKARIFGAWKFCYDNGKSPSIRTDFREVRGETRWARSIQPKFPEISVQNSVDRLKKEKLEKFRNKTGPSLEVDHFSRYDGLEILVEWIAPFKEGKGVADVQLAIVLTKLARWEAVSPSVLFFFWQW